eukprot:759570-Hanusia_phi.AAC.3
MVSPLSSSSVLSSPLLSSPLLSSPLLSFLTAHFLSKPTAQRPTLLRQDGQVGLDERAEYSRRREESEKRSRLRRGDKESG